MSEDTSKIFLISTLVGALAVSIAALFLPPDRCLNTASAFLGIGALVQGYISGLFKNAFDVYSDLEKWPFGPPSSFVRRTIDNPDTPIRTAVRNYLFSTQPRLSISLEFLSLSRA